MASAKAFALEMQGEKSFGGSGAPAHLCRVSYQRPSSEATGILRSAQRLLEVTDEHICSRRQPLRRQVGDPNSKGGAMTAPGGAIRPAEWLGPLTAGGRQAVQDGHLGLLEIGEGENAFGPLFLTRF